MGKWKPIGDLPKNHTGYAWLRHQDCVSLGWRGPGGCLGYCDGEINLGDSPTHFLLCDKTRPVVKAKKETSKPSSWVRVEYQKPGDRENILTWDGIEIRDTSYYASTNKWLQVGTIGTTYERYIQPTHWRPLPKGPKENE